MISFVEFLNLAHSVAHSSRAILEILKSQGLQQAAEYDSSLRHCYIKRGDSLALLSINNPDPSKGIKIFSAHLDYPGFKVKPNGLSYNGGCFYLALENYGAPILSSWLDRDLSIAGRVYGINQQKLWQQNLVDAGRPLLRLANPALHLDRALNNTRTFDKQKEFNGLLSIDNKNLECSWQDVLQHIFSPTLDQQQIINHDLYLYDSQPAAHIGMDNELIGGQGMDNLLSCYSLLKLFIEDNSTENVLIVFFDNEEIGSTTYSGANSNFLECVFSSIYKDHKDILQSYRNSILISLDVAHAYNANYSELYDKLHQPLLNMGPVIKFSAQQRYTSTGKLASFIQSLWQQYNIDYQQYVNHSNIPAGSTVGPFIASRLGIMAIDIGLPILAMHSIRETAGSKDLQIMDKALKAINNAKLPIELFS